MPYSKQGKKLGNGRGSPEPGPSKRDKHSSDEEDDPFPRKEKGASCSKMSKLGKINKKVPSITKLGGMHTSCHNKPAELFRKDLISAMKLPDTEILYESEYLIISDPWRQEWEKGVQVPVNEEEIMPLVITPLTKQTIAEDFKLPPRKYMHDQMDETYVQAQHDLTGMQEIADQIVRYDLDDQDVQWLELVNQDREEMGLQIINEWNLERMIEELENQCYTKTNALKKTEEGLGIEYDEDVACDVCRMLESEDTNEMVFCDGCDICVHQACYGIQTIPEGTWLCRICALGIKPMCLLCPKRGGAMKPTKSATKWTHVSCALWIPEVSIGCPEKMEPITKISNIPPSRWALVCCLCKERVGACIQCSVKQCKTAFHVTCGFAHNLDMRTIVDDSDDIDGITLRAYCPKHTKNRNASDSDSPKKESQEEEENDISEAEMAKKRMEKLNQLEEEFYTLVDQKEVAQKFYIPEEAVDVVSEYWKLKRKANNNKPLITPKMEEEDQMQRQQKDSLHARMKMFVHLRQDLERARNLCYMISKREKTKRQLFNIKETVFRAQLQILTDPDSNMNAREAERVRQMSRFSSIYSDHSQKSVLSNKPPRENLFTLENLKTPKDHEEEKERAKAGGKTNGKKSMEKKADASAKKKKEKKDKKESGKRDKDVTNLTPGSPKKEKAKDKDDKNETVEIVIQEENDLLTMDNTEEQNEEVSSKSRLGKVSPKVVEEVTELGEPSDAKVTVDDADVLNKKNLIPSDLRKKLTSILQSNTMMQKRQEKSDSHSETQSIDVENSEDETVSPEVKTETPLPVEERRNLFDQFSSVQDLEIKVQPPTHSITKELPINSTTEVPATKSADEEHSFEETSLKEEEKESFEEIKLKEEEKESFEEIKSKEEEKGEERSHSSRKKAKRRKHSRSSHKHKRPRKSPSPATSDRCRLSVSPIIIKTEGDSIISKQSSRSSSEAILTSSKEKSPQSHETAHDKPSVNSSDIQSPSSKSSKSSKKKRSRRDRNSEGDRLRSDSSSASPSKARKHHRQRSTSPAAAANSSSLHVSDGDKTLPEKEEPEETEHSIKLEDPPLSVLGKEGRLKLHRKLRLKKQLSPVKGVVSYEVIKDDEEEEGQKSIPQRDGDEQKQEKTMPVRHKGDNVFENVKKASSFHKLDENETGDTSVTSKTNNRLSSKESDMKKEAEETNKLLKTSDKKSVLKTPDSKLHQSKTANLVNRVSTAKMKEEIVDVEAKTDGKSQTISIDVTPEKRITRSGLFHQEGAPSSPSAGLDNSSDENFRPCGRTSKVSPLGKPRRPQRLRTRRQLHPDEADGEEEVDDEDVDDNESVANCSKEKDLPKRMSVSSSHTSNGFTRRGVQLKSPLPDKPDLNKLLLDPSKLVVKESLRRKVGDRLSYALKGRSRWPLVRSNQTTMDKFVQRTNSCENVFSKPDIIRDPNAKRLSLPMARSDLSPLSVNKSSSVINSGQGKPNDALLSSISPAKDSSPRGSLGNYHIPRLKDLSSPLKDLKACSQLSSTTANEADDVFGTVEKLQRPGLRRQAPFENIDSSGDNPDSFQRLRESTLDLAAVVNTPSKCDPARLNEDHLDGSQSYRSPSPVSSIASVASSRLGRPHVGRGEDEDDEEEITPSKRVTRSHAFEEVSSSPSSRLRSRDAIVKPPKLTLS